MAMVKNVSVCSSTGWASLGDLMDMAALSPSLERVSLAVQGGSAHYVPLPRRP